MAKHVKPVSFKEAMKSLPPKGLREIVIAHLNRQVKKAIRNFGTAPYVITVPNHLSPELAQEIAADYGKVGWKVKAEDLRGSEPTNTPWRFTFVAGGP